MAGGRVVERGGLTSWEMSAELGLAEGCNPERETRYLLANPQEIDALNFNAM
jgi:hypothetical protein